VATSLLSAAGLRDLVLGLTLGLDLDLFLEVAIFKAIYYCFEGDLSFYFS